METLLVALSLFALQSADICAEPVEGGVGEPMFCQVEPELRVETPYFSIDTDPEFLVGLDSGGQRIRMQGSIRQEQAVLEIKVTSLAEFAERRLRWRECSDYQLNGAEGTLCERSGNAQVWREYLLRRGDVSVVVNISASELGMSSFPRLEQIFESLEIHGIQP